MAPTRSRPRPRVLPGLLLGALGLTAPLPSAAQAGPAAGERYQGRPLAEAREGLRSSDPERQRRAALAVYRIGARDPQALTFLEDVLTRQPSAAARERAAWALAAFGPDALPLLERALADPAPGVREAGARSAATWMPAHGVALGAGAQRLRQRLLALASSAGEEAPLREHAVEALGAGAASAPETLHALAPLLAEPAYGLSRAAAAALLGAGEPGRALLVAALALPPRAAVAARALLEAQAPSRPPLPVLLEALERLPAVEGDLARARLEALAAEQRLRALLRAVAAGDKLRRLSPRDDALALGEEALGLLPGLLAPEASPTPRAAAASLAGALLPARASLLPALVAAAGDPDVAVRRAAAQALAQVPAALAEALAAGTLGRDDERDDPTLTTLLLALTGAEPGEGPRAAALRAAVERLAARLPEGAALQAAEAARAALLPPGPARDDLVERALRLGDRHVRGALARRIGAWGAQARPLVPRLAALLAASDGDVRAAAHDALRALGPHAADSEPALRAAAERGTHEERRQALGTLAGLGRAARPAVPLLLSLAAGGGLREEALEALPDLADDPALGARVARAAAPLLGDRAQNHQRAAARALGRAGPAGWAALVEAFTRTQPGAEDTGAAWAAAVGFEHAPPEALGLLEETLLAHADPLRRAGSARALSGLRAPAARRLKLLAHALEDGHFAVRGAAAESLAVLAALPGEADRGVAAAAASLVAEVRATDPDLWVRAQASP